MRIEIIRNSEIISTITPDQKEGEDDYQISSSSSVRSFPTLSIKSSNPEINAPFMSFSKGDIIRLSVPDSLNREYRTLFEGAFYRKSTKMETESNTLVLEIDAIHSFFMLSTLELSSSEYFSEITFDDFLSKLFDLTGYNSKLSISPELLNVKISGVSHNTNAFRVFKEVCLMVNAAVTFNTDNTISIDSRAEKLNRLRSRETQTITDNDIISLESSESL